MKHYDAIIIGFGKGGKTLAGVLAGQGQTVALIEKSKEMYGGTCINVGCIPSKSMKTSAERSQLAGGSFDQRAARYAAAVAERARLTAMLRGKNYHKAADQPNIDVLDGMARFTGRDRVEVDFGDRREEFSADRLFLNTGSVAKNPEIPGGEESRFLYTSETLMALPTLPKRLVIVGGGYIGMEFASMYANFGAAVTVLQHGSAFLPREDEEIAAQVLERLRQLGVTVLFSAETRSVTDGPHEAILQVETPEGVQTIEAEAVLLAAGRVPNTAGLQLELGGVEVTGRGAVKTDEHLRTSNPNVYAMGDVVGGLQFTYISLDDQRIVKSALLGDGSRTTANRGAVPYSVFLDPPFSRVGLTEREAREQGRHVKVARLPAAAIPKAQVLGETAGLLKAVVDADSGEILGAHLFCAESHEIIDLVKLAMDAHLPYTALRDNIFTHPTMAESLNDLFSSLAD